MAGNVNALQLEIAVKMDGFKASMEAAQREMKNLRAEVESSKAKNSALRKEVKTLKTSYKETTAALRAKAQAQQKARKSTTQLGSTFRKTADMAWKLRLGYLASTAGLAMLIKSSIDTAVSFENMRLSITAAAGSIEEGNKAMSRAMSIAQEFGLAIEDTANAYSRLMVATKGSAIEGEKTDKIFRQVAQAARVYGLSNEELSGTIRAMEQMASKSVVQMEELKNQLGDRLPGALGTAADAMDMTRAELFKMVETGTLAADEFLPKFAQALADATEASAEFAKNSPQAAFNRLSNSVKNLEDSLARSGMIDTLTKIADGAAVLLMMMAKDDNKTLPHLNAELRNTEVELYGATVKVRQLQDEISRKTEAGGFLNALKMPLLHAELEEARNELKRLETQVAESTKFINEKFGNGIKPPSLKTVSSSVNEMILDIAKAAAKGPEKTKLELERIKKVSEMATAGLQKTISEQEADIAASQKRISDIKSGAQEGDVELFQAHLDKTTEALARTQAEKIQLEQNYALAKKELDRKLENEELSRMREKMQKAVKIRLDGLQQLTAAEQNLGSGLFQEVTGSGQFSDIRKDRDEGMAGLGQGDISGVNSEHTAFVEEMTAKYAELKALIHSVPLQPEQEAMRQQMLMELNNNFNESMKEGQEDLLAHKEQMYAEMIGLDKNYFTNARKMSEMSKSQQLSTAAGMFSQLITLSGTKSKKLLKIQAVVDAASTMASAWKAAAGAMADTPGDPYTRAAAGAAMLSAGLGALANLKAAFSSAGASVGGGGGTSSGFSAPAGQTAAASGALTQEPEAAPDPRQVTFEFTGDDEAMFSGQYLRRLLDRMNEEQEDGAVLIRVS